MLKVLKIEDWAKNWEAKLLRNVEAGISYLVLQTVDVKGCHPAGLMVCC
jgi:hypothetical protein